MRFWERVLCCAMLVIGLNMWAGLDLDRDWSQSIGMGLIVTAVYWGR